MNWTLELLAVFAGLLTVFSPCILPLLPPLLSASIAGPLRHRPFWIVSGLTAGFAFFGIVFAFFGNFLGLSNNFLRQVALGVLFFFSLAMIWPSLWERTGSRISSIAQRITGNNRSVDEQGRLHALVIGASLGLIWAPCAGPILGIILTLATVQKSLGQTLLLMGLYSMGAAVPMLLIGYGGQRVFRQFQKFRTWGPLSHKLLALFTLATVVGLYFNLDTLLLSHLPGQFFIGNRIEKELVEKKEPLPMPGIALASDEAVSLPVLGTIPEFAQITAWINSPALSSSDLKGKVVLVDFWTYSCINCIRTLPYVTQWHEKYKDQGLMVIGVHTPEFSFEKEEANVKQAILRHGIRYPVAMDNDYGTWNAYHNHYWPAHYLIDAQGKIREVHFGEGNYEETERAIQTLLAEARLLRRPVGLEAPKDLVDFSKIHSFETYLGYDRTDHFASPQGLRPDAVLTYSVPPTLRLNHWALAGSWKITNEAAVLQAMQGGIRLRFEAPKLNLVMTGGEKGSRAKVFLDGQPIPPNLRGSDVGSDGGLTVTDSKLYNLVSLPQSDGGDHLFELIFERPGVKLFAFTFG
jgi:cytochrome c biogenesis protein CcdA/thiol-disulfide isomerase/thioredoxin